MVKRLGIPGQKILLILQDLIRILTRMFCKSLQESSTTSAETAYKILAKTSCQDSSKILQDLTRLKNSFVPRWHVLER